VVRIVEGKKKARDGDIRQLGVRERRGQAGGL